MVHGSLRFRKKDGSYQARQDSFFHSYKALSLVGKNKKIFQKGVDNRKEV
jgi:hypothetical protein